MINYPMDDGSLRPMGTINARNDFRKARQQAAISSLWSYLTGKSIDLLPYDEVARKLKVAGGVDRGLKDIPIKSIIGSVSRQSDFTRGFLPRSDRDEIRWAKVKAAMSNMAEGGLDPIQVYQIGEAYFVSDGHHRISIAKQLGADHIQAYVIEILTKVPLTPDIQPSELIIKAEYADFLEQTRLDELRPDAKVEYTLPGLYTKTLNHIEVHRYYMGLDQKREISNAEAVTHWYDEVYSPIIKIIRGRNLLHEFPGRSEADLYIWVSEHNEYMRIELGWKIRPDAAAQSLTEQFSPTIGHALARIGKKLESILIPAEFESGPLPGAWRRERESAQDDQPVFQDILVALSGSKTSWRALDQAIMLARQEGSFILGLSITNSPSSQKQTRVDAIRDEFTRRCKEAGIAGSIAFDQGRIAPLISNRSSYADILVISLSHPPSTHPLARFRSGFRTILRLCPRPILVVPGEARPLCDFLLAYDGSPKADEALYLTTYLAERCKTQVLVATVMEDAARREMTAQRAKAYLDEHHISCVTITQRGKVAKTLLEISYAHDAGMIVMGSYGANPLMEIFVGSTLDGILNHSTIPVLVCR